MGEPRQQFLAHGRFASEAEEPHGRGHFKHIPGQMYPRPFVVSEATPDFTTTAMDMKNDLTIDLGPDVSAAVASRPREWRPRKKSQWYYGDGHVDHRWAAIKNSEAEAAARLPPSWSCHSP